jgi:secreted trypsin-like serine protease
MRRQRFNLQLLILVFFLTLTMMVALFSSTPGARAQDMDPPTPTPEIEIQIVGGDPSDPGEWPWQVALVGRSSDNEFYYGAGYQFCGGSLIHPKWVLTAAHCVTTNGVQDAANTIDVVAGIYDLASTTGYQRVQITQIIRHPSFNEGLLLNDIALLELSTPIIIGGSGAGTTAVIPLATSSMGSLAGQAATVTGWGNTSSTSEVWPFELYEVSVPVISNTACSAYYGNIPATYLCAYASGKDSCQGDSGGPLVINNGQWVLAGIVSWGVGCGENPGVYTRVSQYVSWVNSQADIINPAVSSSMRANANPTHATSVNFTVTFSESVIGVDSSDFSLTTSGLSGSAITGISGSGSIYTVTVDTGSGEGTIRLDVVDDDTIMDASSNVLGGVGAGNGTFISGQSYTMDRTPPDVLSILRIKANPNASAQVSFVVTLSESVTGVDATDFVLTTSGVSGASVGSISGSGATRVVFVNTGSGDGTIRLDVSDDDSILDLATNPLDDDFTTGETYTIDKPDLPAPVLRSPRTNLTSNNTLPTFWWTAVKGGASYEIEFATDNAFTTGLVGDTIGVTSYTASTPFTDGLYYWHVRAFTATSQAGTWSAARTFIVDTSGPAAPTLTSPADSVVTSTTTFRWNAVATAVSYELEYDDDPGFGSSRRISNIRTNSRRPPAMSAGTYYWRVRAKDAIGNWGTWSSPFTVIITGP